MDKEKWYMVDYYSAFKKEGHPIIATNCMNLEDILNEICHAQKDKFHMISLNVESKITKLKPEVE